MKIEQYIDAIKQWYTLPSVKFEIISFLKNRETSFLISQIFQSPEIRIFSRRMMKIHSVQHLDFYIDYTRFFKEKIPYNIYYSLAKYKFGIPNKVFNSDAMKKIREDWIQNHHKEMVSYDFLLDIDCGHVDDFKYAKKTMLLVFDEFNKSKIPFELRFSGRGYHFIIPYEYFTKCSGSTTLFSPEKFDSIYKLHARMGLYFRDNFSEMIDTGIYDSRRLIKCPYTLGIYEDGLYCCSPIFSLEDAKRLNLSDFKVENLFFKLDNKKRGTKLFNPDGNIINYLKEKHILNKGDKHGT